MRRLRLTAALAVAAAVLLACGTTTASDSTSTAGQTPAGTLAFTATTVDGATFQGTSLEGKDAVLWF